MVNVNLKLIYTIKSGFVKMTNFSRMFCMDLIKTGSCIRIRKRNSNAKCGSAITWT